MCTEMRIQKPLVSFAILLKPLKCCDNCRQAFLPVHCTIQWSLYECARALNFQVRALTARLCRSPFLEVGWVSFPGPLISGVSSALYFYFSFFLFFGWSVRTVV